MILIGNSGFGYTSTIDSRANKHHYVNVKIFNIKTNEVLYTLKGGHKWSGRGTGARKTIYNPSKTFLGFDERYYHIQVGHSVSWGQVQSDGAVLKSDRSILKHIDFYPLYIKKAPVEIPSAAPIMPVMPVEPEFKNFKDAEKYYLPKTKEISWIQKIINWIIKILNR